MTETAQQQKDATPATKKPWQSKTLWLAVLTTVVPAVYPPAGTWIAANPEVASIALGAVFAAVRLVTHGKITIQ